MHKGSEMAIFAFRDANENDEIARYQMGRYISSNEAVWRILGFPIHEREPAVIHLAIHLENKTFAFKSYIDIFMWRNIAKVVSQE